MKKVVMLVMVLVVSCATYAADLAADVRSHLAQPNVLRGEFEQAKQVRGFKKQLLSKGDFLVARERGVVWRTREPFAGVLKLTPNEIVATQGRDVAFRLSASTEPTVSVINRLMFSLLNGDVAALGEQFTLSGTVDVKSWSLVLVPKQAAFAKILARVELGGDSYVRRIVMDEANGDKTTISFHGQRPDPAKLTAEEAHWFD
nr:outer membrane lipoprotein carrier protein LolA [Rhodoferax sp.]